MTRREFAGILSNDYYGVFVPCFLGLKHNNRFTATSKKNTVPVEMSIYIHTFAVGDWEIL